MNCDSACIRNTPASILDPRQEISVCQTCFEPGFCYDLLWFPWVTPLGFLHITPLLPVMLTSLQLKHPAIRPVIYCVFGLISDTCRVAWLAYRWPQPLGTSARPVFIYETDTPGKQSCHSSRTLGTREIPRQPSQPLSHSFHNPFLSVFITRVSMFLPYSCVQSPFPPPFVSLWS